MSYNELCAEVVNGNDSKVIELTKKLIEAGNDPSDVMNKGLIAGMDIVGRVSKMARCSFLKCFCVPKQCILV